MKQNMGTFDRGVRAIAALIIAALYLTNVISGALGIGLLIVAAIFLATAVVNFCPLYLPFGISTKEKV